MFVCPQTAAIIPWRFMHLVLNLEIKQPTAYKNSDIAIVLKLFVTYRDENSPVLDHKSRHDLLDWIPMGESEFQRSVHICESSLQILSILPSFESGCLGLAACKASCVDHENSCSTLCKPMDNQGGRFFVFNSCRHGGTVQWSAVMQTLKWSGVDGCIPFCRANY